MELLSFGPFLERCRFFFLPQLISCRRALILGDGDGRFLARLLAVNPNLCAHAVDASPAMLHLLTARVERIGAQQRVATSCADIRRFEPPDGGYDLVATHFFLDCLTAEETESLIARLQPHLVPGARWVVSEFEVPGGGPARAWLARGVIAFLYSAFRLLTGLTVRRIPPWSSLLARRGFTRAASHSWLGGLLVAELWEAPRATGREPLRSHQE